MVKNIEVEKRKRCNEEITILCLKTSDKWLLAWALPSGCTLTNTGQLKHNHQELIGYVGGQDETLQREPRGTLILLSTAK